jgi:aspartate/methionine/tyrosine aminotransferase
MTIPSPHRPAAPAPKIAARGDIAPFYVMEVMKAARERAQAGGDVLHLEVGQPSTGAPEGVLAAATRALRSGPLGYTDATGLPELRERIARHYADAHGAAIGADRVIVTTGASGGCVLAFLAAFDAGDRVAVLEPGYPCYRNMLEAFGVEVVGLAVGSETRFQATTAMLEEALPLAGLVIASPSNPTGTSLPADELDVIVDWCRARGVRLICDEIYHRITYGEPAPSAVTRWDEAVIVNSFSKYYSMTGWRLGWLVVPPALAPSIERLAQNLTIAPPTLSQVAAVAAFACEEELDGHVARYAENRRVLLDGLAAAGLTDAAPADGAFYAYARTDAIAPDSQMLCAHWLAELGVAATPGVDFDPGRGHRWVRFSFAGATADVAEAVGRLERWARAGG